MTSKELSKMIDSLSDEQVTAVEEFIRYLKQRNAHSDYRAALESFIRDHRELLKRLAQ